MFISIRQIQTQPDNEDVVLTDETLLLDNPKTDTSGLMKFINWLHS